jgi:predicted dehydrogenase
MSDALGIIVNGVTGRMGYRQHLVRSLLAIREQGGVPLSDGTRVQVEPILVGRNIARLEEIARRHDIAAFTTDLAEALAMPQVGIYFDAQVTSARAAAIRAAVAAGKHVYTEKPSAETAADALELATLADEAGVKNGVVHDKLYLPGLRKLKRLVDEGFFGRILSVRGEFGYWVFDGASQLAQRPSWNYRAADGGGIVLDMFCHWNYVLENIIAPVRSVSATTRTHLSRRYDERSVAYEATAEDAAYAIFELEGDVVAQINSSWTVRVNRDELVEFQVDGVDGSAVAGLWACRVQPAAATPKAVWNPDLRETHRFRDDWLEVPDNVEFDNAFKVQWEEFIRHVAEDAPHPYDFMAGVRGLRLAEAGVQSAVEGRRIELSP